MGAAPLGNPLAGLCPRSLLPGGAAVSQLCGAAALCSPEFPRSVVLVSLSVRSLLFSLLIFSSLKGVCRVVDEEEALHKPSMLRSTGWEGFTRVE